MRAFIAVQPDATTMRYLRAHARRLRASGDLSSVRWAGEDTWHVTVRFLGEISEQQSQDIAGWLAARIGDHRPFEVYVTGPRWFPSASHPRVIACMIERSEAMTALARECEQAARHAGVAPETRSFHGHITLARINFSRGEARTASLGDDATGCAMTVSNLILFRSELTPRGARHAALATFRLGGDQP